MKKTMLAMTVTLLVLLVGAVTIHAQPMGPGMMGPGYGSDPQGSWEYCPYCGSYMGPRGGYGMGPGMMGRGYGMGPGMHRGWGMGPGYGMGPGMHRGWGMGQSPQYGPGYSYPQQSQEPLDKDKAEEIVKNYIESSRNPNLKVGDVKEKGPGFEAEIVTKDGSLVDKVIVDKNTGWIRSAY